VLAGHFRAWRPGIHAPHAFSGLWVIPPRVHCVLPVLDGSAAPNAYRSEAEQESCQGCACASPFFSGCCADNGASLPETSPANGTCRRACSGKDDMVLPRLRGIAPAPQAEDHLPRETAALHSCHATSRISATHSRVICLSLLLIARTHRRRGACNCASLNPRKARITSQLPHISAPDAAPCARHDHGARALLRSRLCVPVQRLSAAAYTGYLVLPARLRKFRAPPLQSSAPRSTLRTDRLTAATKKKTHPNLPENTGARSSCRAHPADSLAAQHGCS